MKCKSILWLDFRLSTFSRLIAGKLMVSSLVFPSGVGIWTKFNAWSFPSVADFVSLYFFHYVCLFFVFLLLLLFFFWQPSWQDSNSNPRDRIRSWLASETRRKMSEKLSERCVVVWCVGCEEGFNRATDGHKNNKNPNTAEICRCLRVHLHRDP